jgi:hypothetical protein
MVSTSWSIIVDAGVHEPFLTHLNSLRVSQNVLEDDEGVDTDTLLVRHVIIMTRVLAVDTPA